MTCKPDHKPVLVLCPICQPGPYSFAGTIISRTCKGCAALLKGGK